MSKYIKYGEKTAFVKPIDGDVLNNYDGEEGNGKLWTDVILKSERAVCVNGIPAEKGEDGLYRARVGLSSGWNTLTAESECGKDEIKVRYTDADVGYYRLSSDDNIIFLSDINKNKDVYKSIFDNPYLAVYKKAHDLYGAKIHLNIYYEMPEHPDFTGKRDYFNLSMMTDKFKSEWKANSDWLKMNFHANSDKPDKPYLTAGYDKVYSECKRVQDEIRRFAGEKTLSDETTIHWGATTEEGVKAARDLGIKALAGYMKIEGSRTVVSYHYPKDLVAYLERRDFWYDRSLDMYFAKIDCVLNLHTPEEIEGLLNTLYTDKTRSGFIEIMMHEEYFYPDYTAYEPDFEKRVLTGCRFACEKGYKGAFLAEVI